MSKNCLLIHRREIMDQRLFLKRFIGEHQELFRRAALAIWNYA